MTRAREEQRIQTAIVTALHRAFDCRCVHVPNGGARGKLEAIAFKAEGLSISWAALKGRPSWDDKAIREAAQAAGIDLTPFSKVGDPSDRLTISTR